MSKASRVLSVFDAPESANHFIHVHTWSPCQSRSIIAKARFRVVPPVAAPIDHSPKGGRLSSKVHRGPAVSSPSFDGAARL